MKKSSIDMINREIINRNYSDESLRLKPATKYDEEIIKLRFSYIKNYGVGKEVLDLCCGTGSYLIPVLDRVKNAVGVDFSSTMLAGFKKDLHGKIPSHLKIIEADARDLTLHNNSIDFVFSYTSLYTVPDVELVIKEVARVLRPGGHAVLELGNLWSLNFLVSMVQYKKSGWCKPFFVSYNNMHRYFKDAGLDVIKKHSFQLLPMYGAPRSLFYLRPFLSPFWKKILGVKIGERILDDWISGSWPLKYFAFRHLFLLKKGTKI